MLLVHHEILRMVHVVGVRVFYPNPEWLAGLAMCTVIPFEIAENLEHDAQYSACNGLDGCLDVEQWNLLDTILHPCTHVNMTDHVTYTW